MGDATPGARMTQLVRLTLQYTGTAYAGWQIQPGVPTVQGTIEQAAQQITGETVRLFAAGRTDAGVHARAQVAHFETSSTLSPERLAAALNEDLPRDIRVTGAAIAIPGFHARRGAIAKEYRYFLYRGAAVVPDRGPFTLLVRRALDEPAMREAARGFVGTHDFAALRSAGSSAVSTVRSVRAAEWRDEGPELVFRIEADGYLYKMVRTIVGTLLEVGRGRRAPESIPEVLKGRDRSLAGPVAPARGLHLWEVRYPPGNDAAHASR